MSEDEQKKLLIRVKEALEELRDTVDIGSGTITSSETEDLDWINNWKQYFHQFYVDDLLVIPSWEEVKPEDIRAALILPPDSLTEGSHFPITSK